MRLLLPASARRGGPNAEVRLAFPKCHRHSYSPTSKPKAQKAPNIASRTIFVYLRRTFRYRTAMQLFNGANTANNPGSVRALSALDLSAVACLPPHTPGWDCFRGAVPVLVRLRAGVIAP